MIKFLIIWSGISVANNLSLEATSTETHLIPCNTKIKMFSNALSSALPSLIFSINVLTRFTNFSATVFVVEKPNTWVKAVPIGLSMVPSDWKLVSSSSNIFCLPPRSTKACANSVALLPTAPNVSAAILPHLVQN